MIAQVEPPQDGDFHQHADDRRDRHAGTHRQQKAAAACLGPRGDERAHHVKRPVGKVDQAHDAEHQGQPSCQQKQRNAVLQPVEELFGEERHAPLDLAAFRVRIAPIGQDPGFCHQCQLAVSALFGA